MNDIWVYLFFNQTGDRSSNRGIKSGELKSLNVGNILLGTIHTRMSGTLSSAVHERSTEDYAMTGYIIVDTHAHLGDPVFDPDRAEVLRRAKAAGVAAILTVSENLAGAERSIKFAEMHPMMLPAAEAGFFFSIPPSVVRSAQKQKIVRNLPLTSLLIETDSPVLGPSRERRNEPANALISVDMIAELKSISKEEVLEVVSQNTRKLYGDIKGFPLQA